ncbi:MAG: IS5 family transposase [Streptosporangiaceae bacterium]
MGAVAAVSAGRTGSKRGRRQRTDGRSSPAELVRPPGGGGAGAEGLGRSRGGFTAKTHLSADGRCRPLSLLITEGQRADCTQFEAVLDKIRVPRPVGRPRRKPGSVAADKAYTNTLIRRYLRRRGISHTIPEKSDSQAAPRRKGSRRGRAPGFGAERYKKRNTVERAINKLKQFRAVVTRCDKRYIYLGTTTVAALVIWLRS